MYKTALELIEQLFSAEWSLTPIAWDNVAYTPSPGTPFVRLTATQVDSILTSGTADAGNYRESGLVTVQVFTPGGEGGAINAVLASAVAEIFRGHNIGRLYLNAPYINRIGESGEWYQSNVITDFYFDYCTA